MNTHLATISIMLLLFAFIGLVMYFGLLFGIILDIHPIISISSIFIFIGLYYGIYREVKKYEQRQQEEN